MKFDYRDSPWLWFIAELAPYVLTCGLIAWLAAGCRKYFPLTNDVVGCAIPVALMIPWLFNFNHRIAPARLLLQPPLGFSLLCAFAVVFTLGWLRRAKRHSALAWFVLALTVRVFWASLCIIASQG